MSRTIFCSKDNLEKNLSDKIYIVTGTTSGIGLETVTQLAKQSATVICAARNIDLSKTIINNIKKETKNDKISFLHLDLNSLQSVREFIKQFNDKFSRLDGLVNNAGVNDGIGLEKGTYEDFLNSINKNVAHYYKMTQLVLPELKKNKGAIVNIGSKVSATGQGGTSGYAAACGGRNALTREWAVELIPYSIRVNSVIVAECYTPLYEKWINSFDNPEEKYEFSLKFMLFCL